MTDKPTIDETYSRAGNTSDLTVEARQRGAGDVMIAAGWSDSRIGSALLRLQSEADGAQRKANATDMMLIAGRLAGLKPLVTVLAARALLWAEPPSRPETLAREVLLWWLDQTCKLCHGRRWVVIPGAPALSNRNCPRCHAIGTMPVPYGFMGRKLATTMDTCLSTARGQINARLRNYHK